MHTEGFSLTLQGREEIASNAIRLEFGYAGNQFTDFKPGQYIKLYHEAGSHDGCCYSLSEHSTQDKTVSFILATRHQGAMTKQLLSLDLGSQIDCSGPYGNMIMTSPRPKRIVLLATGTGISPFHAMLEQFSQDYIEDSTIELIYGVNTFDETVYHQNFLDMAAKHSNFHFTLCINQPTTPCNAPKTIESVLDKLAPLAAKDAIYLSGNPDTVKNLAKYCCSLGAGPDQLHSDLLLSNSV